MRDLTGEKIAFAVAKEGIEQVERTSPREAVKDAVALIKTFFDNDLPGAAICHAPWSLVEADVARGSTLASWPSLQTDLRNAGAAWKDQEVVVDCNLVTSREPDDLAACNEAALTAFAG